MRHFVDDIKKIYFEERFSLILMVVNFLLAAVLLVMGLMNLNPDSVIVRVGYGDIGGYRDGVWQDFLVFPVLAVTFGVIHNALALVIYEKRGAGMMKFFLIMTTALILGATFLLVRLLGEV